MTDADANSAPPRRGAGDSSALIDYSPLAKIFHWLTAGLIFLMIASGVAMTQLGDGQIADTLFSAHKMTGVLILGVVILRWFHRLAMRLRGRWVAQTGHRRIHGVLYAVIVAVPLLGWAGVSDFGARRVLFGWELPSIWPEGLGYADALLTAHAWLAFSLLLLVFVHIGLALEDYIMRSGAAATAGKPHDVAADLNRPAAV